MNSTTTITNISKRGWMWRVEWNDGTATWVQVCKTAHNDSRKWNAQPLLRCAAGSVPLADLSRSNATRKGAIIRAAVAYREAQPAA